MKKLLLFSLLVCFIATNAQQYRAGFTSASAKLPPAKYYDGASTLSTPSVPVQRTAHPYNSNRDIRGVNPIEIGSSANAYGFLGSGTTFLWADNNINSVSFVHRMPASPGSGYLGYDLSTDGGLTWVNNIQAYDPNLSEAFPARYPQGGIYNPPGNTDPNNAYFAYFAPTLDATNPGYATPVDWGGYAWGVKGLAEGALPTQTNLGTEDPFYHLLPSGYTITQTGEVWMVDESSLGVPNDDGFVYQGNLIIGHGVWDVDLNDFVFSYDLLPLEAESGGGINDVKVAFSPDGQTGYICALTSRPDTLPYTSYHPILFKTTDGGNSWSDPIEVQLGGTDGLEAIKYFISDARLETFYAPDPVPPRDEIMYYFGYYCDLAVDAWGNPHLAGMICIAEGTSIWTGVDIMDIFHIWSDDQGDTWRAFNISDDLRRHDAPYGSGANIITNYNRAQVATTQDGAIVFFSFLDTKDSLIAKNTSPDIFFRDYIPSLDKHSDSVENVTFFSAAMWVSHFGCMSEHVFSEVTESNYTCRIPFAYTELTLVGTVLDPTQPAKFFYIPDYVKEYTFTGIGDKNPKAPAMVSQNFPNPFSTNTTIRVNLLQDTDLTMEIHNLTGSLVATKDFGKVSRGIQDLEFNADGLSKGIYFYTVNAGTDKVTRKMIIQ